MEIIKAERLKDPSFSSSLAKLIIGGSIICYPTDTCYAIGTNALNEQSVYSIYMIKEREFSKPLPVIIRDIEAAKKFSVLDIKARRLFERFPGISLVLPKRNIPNIVNPTRIMVRIPEDEIVRAMMSNIAIPIISTSANRAGDPNPYSPSDIIASLGDKLPMIQFLIDAGRLTGEMPSTIFDCIEGKVYREGKYTAKEVMEVYNETD
ncbi:MAG: threonylcarbamoyl-AMP synthase [Candidatus Methanofastidiosa archaeon]|nr:threonylcarbamoyl-AMP synthase [Candidatus Methanofastidiosa archaeon]